MKKTLVCLYRYVHMIEITYYHNIRMFTLWTFQFHIYFHMLKWINIYRHVHQQLSALHWFVFLMKLQAGCPEMIVSKELFKLIKPFTVITRIFGLNPITYHVDGTKFGVKWSVGYGIYSYFLAILLGEKRNCDSMILSSRLCSDSGVFWSN